MENKIIKKTHKDYFNELLALKEVKANKELVEFIEGRLEQLNKKSNSDKKTAGNKANMELAEKILAEMEVNKLYTITEMLKNLPSCAEYSNQKISYVVRKELAEKGLVENVKDKRNSYFIKH